MDAIVVALPRAAQRPRPPSAPRRSPLLSPEPPPSDPSPRRTCPHEHLLRSLVERTGIALFLVSHLRRSTSEKHSHEEGGRVTLSSLRGSHSIAQLSDSVVALERDQQSSDEESTTTVRLLKNRYSGEVGVACELKYDLSTCKFKEH